MTEYQLMELVLLAAIAGYLIYKLYLVLGQSDSSAPKNKSGNVIPLRRSEKLKEKMKEHIKVKTNKPQNPLLKDLYEVDPSFDEIAFKKGAEKAFVMIVESFAKGDLKGIKPYLSKKVHDAFLSALEKRSKKGIVIETQVVSITSMDIVKASVSREVAKITLRIQSDQAITHRDAKGKDIYPDQDDIEQVTDQWTFQRKIDNPNPNWILESIEEMGTEKANG